MEISVKLNGYDLIRLLGRVDEAGYGWAEILLPVNQQHLDGDKQFSNKINHAAFRLLSGGYILVMDYNEDDENGYPKRHEITLDDIERGAAKRECVYCLASLATDKNFDYYKASAILQCTVFGNIKYDEALLNN